MLIAGFPVELDIVLRHYCPPTTGRGNLAPVVEDHPLPAFGVTLQLLRQQQELSLNALGKLAGVDPAYLWRLERGEKQDPSLSVVRRIALGLGIAPQAFLTRLLQVEAALEQGKSVGLAPLGPAESADPDAAIFAELLGEREQKERVRRQLSSEWPRILPIPANRPQGTIQVPILGKIAAGKAIRVDEAEVAAWLTVNAAGLPKDPDLFALEVDGDSLIGDNIRIGDFVLCSPRLVPEMVGGQVGVARLYGSELTLKHIYLTSSGVLLRASNPAYPDLELPMSAIEVLGVVVRALPRPSGNAMQEERVD